MLSHVAASEVPEPEDIVWNKSYTEGRTKSKQLHIPVAANQELCKQGSEHTGREPDERENIRGNHGSFWLK